MSDPIPVQSNIAREAGKMAGRPRIRGDEDILNCLAESDAEDFIPSDEDLDDPAYIPEPHQNSSESESESSEEEAQIDLPRQATRGYPRGRGRSRRRQSQPVPSSSGSTSNTEWVIKDFPLKELSITEPSYLPYSDAEYTKIDFFKQYLDDEFAEKIVECTNRTAILMHGRALNFNIKEFYTYLGITFVMAALNYPWLRMYWESKWRVPIIADNMSRNRFTLLRNSIKVVFDGDIEDEVKQKDKLWKMRPIIERVKQGCRRQEKGSRLSIDEMIIPFTGTCGMKQYCPGKPNPVGLKAFVMANPNGLVTDFDVYQGDTTYPDFRESAFGLGEKAVLSLADSLVPGHTLYFDRYFTSLKLANELLLRGLGSTGTIQKNRIPASAKNILIDDKALSRQGRGSVHTIVSQDCVALTKWYDNKPVTMMSTVEGQEPMDVCQRYDKRIRQYVPVDRPVVVKNYNQNMGGVDLADRMLSVCPNRYRTKKWTQRFFSHMIDLAVSNSWLQYKKRELARGTPVKKIQQLRSFKMELGEFLIEFYTLPEPEDSAESTDSEPENREPNRKRKRGRPATELPSKRRRIVGKHLPVFVENQSRCRHCHYNKSRTQCSTCKISLCLTRDRNCYKLFHEE